MNVKAKLYRGRKGHERGSTLIEFTLTILPLLALLMMTVDLAWVLFAWASIHEGAREGVRFAITMQSDAAVINRIQQYSFGFITDPSSVQVNYFSPTDLLHPLQGKYTNSPGNVVQVTVSGVSILPMAPIWRSQSPLVLSASSADIVEPNPNPSASPRN